MPAKARRFGASMLPIATNVKLMEGKAGFDSTVVVVFVNHNATITTGVSLALVDSTDPNDTSAEDFIVFNLDVPANTFTECKGIAVEEGHILVARGNTANVSAIAYGFEEEIG